MYSPQSSPDKIDLFHAYNFNPMAMQTNPEDEVLDLSRRCEQDVRKTPSPYNTPSSSGSPSSQHNEPMGLFNPMQSLHPMYYGNALKQEFQPNPVQSFPAFAQNPVAAAGLLQTMLSQSQEDRMSNTSSPTSSIGAMNGGDLCKTRPFKAYPRDPLVIAANFQAADVLTEKTDSYSEFRKRGLEQIRGARTISNPRMRRTNVRQNQSMDAISNESKSENEERAMESSDNDSNAPEVSLGKPEITPNGIVKDSAYFERRRKNNAAAKKSRDRRRHKEDEIALRNAYLERQNIQLLVQIDTLKAQLAAFTKC